MEQHTVPLDFFQLWEDKHSLKDSKITLERYEAALPEKKAQMLAQKLVSLLGYCETSHMFGVFSSAYLILLSDAPSKFTKWNTIPLHALALVSPDSYNYENLQRWMTAYIMENFSELREETQGRLKTLVQEFYAFVIKVSIRVEVPEQTHVRELYELFQGPDGFHFPLLDSVPLLEDLPRIGDALAVMPICSFLYPPTLEGLEQFDIGWYSKDELRSIYDDGDGPMRARMLASYIVTKIRCFHKLRTFGLWYQLYEMFVLYQPLSCPEWRDPMKVYDPIRLVQSEITSMTTDSEWQSSVLKPVREHMILTLRLAEAETALSKTQLRRWYLELYENTAMFTFEELVDPSKSNVVWSEAPLRIPSRTRQSIASKKVKTPKIEEIRDESPVRK